MAEGRMAALSLFQNFGSSWSYSGESKVNTASGTFWESFCRTTGLADLLVAPIVGGTSMCLLVESSMGDLGIGWTKCKNLFVR